MLRSARLDWYEQGDVRARVADHRDVECDDLTDLYGCRRTITAAAESLNSLYKEELIDFRGNWRGVADVMIETMDGADRT